MVQMKWMAQGLAAMASLVLLSTSCTTLGTPPTLNNDVLSIRNKLDKFVEEEASSNRQLQATTSSIYDNMQGRNDAVKTSLDDLATRTQQQAEELRQLRAQLEALTAAVDTVNRRMGPGGTTTFPAPGAAPAGTTMPPANDAESAFNAARGYYDAGQYDQARTAYGQAVAMNPPEPLKLEAMYGVAMSSFGLKDFDRAREEFKAVISANNKDVMAWKGYEQIANIYIAQGDPKQALILLQDMVEQMRNKNYQYPDVDRVQKTISDLRSQVLGGTSAPAQ